MITTTTEAVTVSDTFDLLKITKEERSMVDESSNPYKGLLAEATREYQYTKSVLDELRKKMTELNAQLDKKYSAVKALELLISLREDDKKIEPPQENAWAASPLHVGERQFEFIKIIQKKAFEMNVSPAEVQISSSELREVEFRIDGFYANNVGSKFIKREIGLRGEKMYSLGEYGLKCYGGRK